MTSRLAPFRRRRDAADAPVPSDAGSRALSAEAEAPGDATAALPLTQVPASSEPGAVGEPVPTQDPPQVGGDATQLAPALLPADVAVPEPGAPQPPSFRDRGRFRRRLRYLRQVRELGFRDLGGLTFDLHRFGRDGAELVAAKLAALDAVDRELRTLERVLDDRRSHTDLREAGIAACPRCAALHGSDARFCPSCGLELSGPLAAGAVAEAQPAGPAPVSAAERGTAPVSAGTPRG